MDFVKIGARLKMAREHAGFTQARAAEILEMEPNSISAIERGARICSFKTFVRLVNLYHSSADEILLDDVPFGRAIHQSDLSKRIEALDPDEATMVADVLNSLIEGVKKIRPQLENS